MINFDEKKVLEVTNLIKEFPKEQFVILKNQLFKGIHYQIEFGVSRFISDRIYHLPKLLAKLELTNVGANSYKLNSHEKTSAGVVGLEYLFEASNDDEAQKIAMIFKGKITGVGERLWLACWDFANEAASWIFEVNTFDLFRRCYPKREARPNGQERKEFFNLIRLLERTKLFLRRETKKKLATTYELPIIQIHSFESSQNLNRWPRRLKLQIMPPTAFEDKMAFVAVPIHRNTLHLSSHDTHLANMLQIRRSQFGNIEEISFALEDLLKGAGLAITARVKMAQAKKLLKEKLERIKNMGIVKDFAFSFPSCLQDKVCIQFPHRIFDSIN